MTKMVRLDELSVFLPAYNEEENLEKTATNVLKILPKVASKWELILVNDGSKDRTGEIAQKLASKDKRVRVITHRPNRGYGAALKSGFYNAKYNWVAFTDADGQFDFSEISDFIEKQAKTGADLVIGYYLKRQVPMVRILGSKFWQLAVFLLFGLKVKDIDCGFKLIRAEVFKEIPKLEAERGPFITSELLIKARKNGFKIVELGVHHFSRQGGKATGASLKVIASGLSDLVRLRSKLRNV